MILRPETPHHGTDEVQPAWNAVEATQRTKGEAALITQPDHARLAGAIAAAFEPKRFARLDESIVSAIAVHDEGWAPFDDAMLRGVRPARSFQDASVSDFVTAWLASIDAAENVSACGGIIVSSHFARLAGARLAAGNDAKEDHATLERFLAEEATRRERLHDLQKCGVADLETLTDILQFCDLLSLYLCCGAEQPVEFPQMLAGSRVRGQWRESSCLLTPSPLARAVEASVTLHRDGASERLLLTIV